MTNRTRNWLIVVSVAVTVGVASWGRMYFTRARIMTEARTWADEVAHDIAEDLKSVEADANDRLLEEELLGYLNRHSRIVGLELYFAPFDRRPLVLRKRQAAGEAPERPIEIPVDLEGPWKATLVMKWAVPSRPSWWNVH